MQVPVPVPVPTLQRFTVWPAGVLPALWKGSLALKTVVKKPKGNAPMPNDMWKPVSPKPWNIWAQTRNRESNEISETPAVFQGKAWESAASPRLCSLAPFSVPEAEVGFSTCNTNSRSQRGHAPSDETEPGRRTWGPPGWSFLCRTAGWPSLCWCPPCTPDTAAGWAASPTTERNETRTPHARVTSTDSNQSGKPCLVQKGSEIRAQMSWRWISRRRPIKVISVFVRRALRHQRRLSTLLLLSLCRR